MGTAVHDARLAATDDLVRLWLEQGKDHALILVGPDGRIARWPAAAEHIFGFAAAEVVGQPLSVLFTPEDRERGLAGHELTVAAADGRSRDDRWHVRKDGTRIWVTGVVVALRDAAGAVVGFAKIARDRTDLKGQIDALENRADALREADERKNVALGTLAHELRSPLAALANALHLIRLVVPPDEPKFANPMQLMGRQVEAIRRMADDLQALTGDGAWKIELKVEAVDLRDVLRQAAEPYLARAAARRQTFEVLVPPGPIAVEADPARLRHAFANLFDNAVKYTPDGGRVWVKATVEGDEAVVKVEDTGCGIPGDLLPRIFDLFTRAPSARDLDPGGAGVGLAVVKELVAGHGGGVQVRSDGEGKGSEFTVRLPLTQPRAGG